MPYFSSLFFKKSFESAALLSAALLYKSCGEGKALLHIFRREHFLPSPLFFFIIIVTCSGPSPSEVFLSWERRKFLPLFPFLDCTLCRCLYNGERGGGPSSSSRQHSTHLRTSPRMERRRTHPPQPFFPPEANFFFPENFFSLLNGLRSKKSSRGRGKRGADGSRIYLLQ